MSLETRPNQEQGKAPQILPEETIEAAKLSADRLIKTLPSLGVEVFNDHFEARDSNSYTGSSDALLTHADLPSAGNPNPSELISERSKYYSATRGKVIIIDANLRFNNEPIQMHIVRDRFMHEDQGIRNLHLVMPITVSANRETLLESLPPGFNSTAFTYDFVRNPEYRERLSAAAQKRVPAKIIAKDYLDSKVTGKITPEGIDAHIQLYLQNPDPKNHLTCYVVQVAKEKSQTDFKITDVAPETIWQPEEGHYCMPQQESYPLIPVKLNEISRLKVEIDGNGSSPEVVADLLNNLPLSIDGTNQWYVSAEISPQESLYLLFKPEWKTNNAALVFKGFINPGITPSEAVRNALIRMDAMRKSLAEKLSA